MIVSERPGNQAWRPVRLQNSFFIHPMISRKCFAVWRRVRMCGYCFCFIALRIRVGDLLFVRRDLAEIAVPAYSPAGLRIGPVRSGCRWLSWMG